MNAVPTLKTEVATWTKKYEDIIDKIADCGAHWNQYRNKVDCKNSDDKFN